jgi:replicative DNA helicase
MSEYANLDLERQVLGQMTHYPGVFEAFVGSGLTRADFYRAVHHHVWDALEAVNARGDTLDIISVGLEMRRRGTLEEVGLGYYNALTNGLVKPDETGIVLFAAELASLAGKREIHAALGNASLEDVAATAERATSRALDERRVYDSAGQLAAVQADITRDAQGRIFLGFPTLDGILEGIRPGEVFGLMARPGIGKTLVLGHVSSRVAEEDFGHVFFSLEMPAAQIVERLARGHYGLSRGYLRDRLSSGVLDVDDYTKAFRRLVIVDAPGLSVAQMGAKLRQLQAGTFRSTPIRLVTVDHLGLIGGDRKMTTYDRVSTQARELKELAKRFNAALLLAVQVNRESGGDGSKELGLGAARDSGVVEEAMDYLVAMRRPERSQTLAAYEREKYRDTLFLKVIKNRHGAPDTEIGVRIDGMTLRLREDAALAIAAEDLTKIATMPLRGRR